MPSRTWRSCERPTVLPFNTCTVYCNLFKGSELSGLFWVYGGRQSYYQYPKRPKTTAHRAAPDPDKKELPDET